MINKFFARNASSRGRIFACVILFAALLLAFGVLASETMPSSSAHSLNAPTATCVAPPSGLVSWWPAENNANDIISSNNGTLQNGATFGAGMVRQAFSFDGVDDQVSVPHNANQNTGTQITIDAWVNPTTSGHGRPIANKRSLSNVGGYTFETTHSPFGPDNGLGWVVWISGTPRTLLTASNVMTTTVWQHVAATYDSAAMKIYVNGVEKASMAQSGSIDAVTDPFVIGGNEVNPAFVWNGFIDELDLFKRALSQSEIQSIFNVASAGKCRLLFLPLVIR